MSDLETLNKAVTELTGHVYTLAKAVMEKEGDYPGERDYVEPEHAAGAVPDIEDDDSDYGMDPNELAKRGAYKGMDDDEDEDDMPMDMPMDIPADDNEYNEEMEMAFKSLRKARRSFLARKGYAGAAKVKSDEHDAPFGDKDSSVAGNQPQPAGAQGGAREDESFGQGESKEIMKSIKQLSQAVGSLHNQINGADKGQVIAKAQAPAVPGSATRNGSESPTLTREMQEQAKGLSYKQLNQFRIDVGDLKPHVIG